MKQLTEWKRLFSWLRYRTVASIPVAAGSVGMGCIGFPYHPVWEVTRACNLKCVHCHAVSGRAEPDELTTEEGLVLIEQIAAEPKFGMLVFTGGEPLVRKDLFDLLAHSRDQRLINVIATNGTLIDDFVAKELRRLGVRGIAVSLDHTESREHNMIRQNPQAFHKALNGMIACREAGILLQVNFTAMPGNLDNIEDMLRLCDELGAGIVLCYQIVSMGRGIHINALSTYTNQVLMEQIARLQSKTFSIVEPVAAPQYWAFLLSRNSHNGRFKEWLSRYLLHGCTAGWGLVYIKPNGEVWPCPFVPISGGNMRDRPFSEIWRKAQIFDDLRHRDRLKGMCGKCRHRFICGGCRGKAYASTGDPLGEDPSCFLWNDMSGNTIKDR